MKTIQLSRPNINNGDIYEQFEDILASGRFTEGKYVKEFECLIKKNTGADYVHTTPSGTSALTLVMRLVKLAVPSQRNEVIMPAFTFGASLVAVLAAGLIPRFVDVCEDGTIDPYQVRLALRDQTACVLAVDAFGLPCKIKEIRGAIKDTDQDGVPLICDSAQAYNASYGGKRYGTQADIHVFSFAPSKVVTCGEGGAITFSGERGKDGTDAEALNDVLQACKNYGFDSDDRRDLVVPGHNGRLSEFNALVGCHSHYQLLQEATARKLIAHHYSSEMHTAVTHMDQRRYYSVNSSSNAMSSLCYYVIRVSNRDELQEKLKGEDIESKPYFSPCLTEMGVFSGESPSGLHLEYRQSEHILVGQRLNLECLALPMHSALTDEDLARVCEVVNEHGRNIE